MLSDLQIEALAHGCAQCGKPFKENHRVTSAYHVRTIRDFELQMELGIAGAGVRNYFVHLDCTNPELTTGWSVIPSIHHCIRCKASLSQADMVQPVFSIDNPKVVNPSDPTDVGISLRERIFFVHCDCKNPGLNKQGSNILVL